MEEQQNNEQQNNEQQEQQPQTDAPQTDAPQVPNETVMQADPVDVEKNKTMAILAYFIFFLPLLTDAKDSPFAKFHANQSLMVFLFMIVVNILGTVIPFLGWFIILPFGIIAGIVFWFMGIMNASGGKMKELPLIGGFHLLDK